MLGLFFAWRVIITVSANVRVMEVCGVGEAFVRWFKTRGYENDIVGPGAGGVNSTF